MNESTGTRYQRLRRTAQVAGLTVGVAWLSLLVFTPLAEAIAQWAGRVAPGWALVLFVLTLAVLWEIIALPIAVYAASRGERRLRKTRVDLATIVTNHARDASTGLVVVLCAAWGIQASLQWAGAWWWLAAGALSAPLLVALTALAGVSVRVAPGSRPVTRQALAERLAALTHRACGHVVPVFEWTDPAAAPTALVTGIGRSGAILLSREMVADWSDDEIAVVVAHELSHHVRHDLCRKAGLDAAVMVVAFWVADRVVAAFGPSPAAAAADQLAALPLIALTVCVMWWVLRPLRLAQSRAHEREADRFAIALTGSVEAFRTAIRRLAAHHLVEERPSTITRWFFHRHPTAEERIEQAGSGL